MQPDALKLGVEEVEKIIDAAADLANAVGAILDDGKVSLADLTKAPALLSALSGFGGVDYKAALPQAVDMQPEEAEKLAARFKTRFNLPNDTTEKTIEKGVDVVVAVGQAVATLRAVWERIQGGKVVAA